jgi:hypothetical protein
MTKKTIEQGKKHADSLIRERDLGDFLEKFFECFKSFFHQIMSSLAD